MKFDFLTFKDNLYDLNQHDSLRSSLLTTDINSEMFTLEYNKLVSSANRIKYKTFEQWTISLIYRMNKRGPRMEPCGTPHTTAP